VATFQQAPGERVAATVAGEFAIRDHPPEACAGCAGADPEQGSHCDKLRHSKTSMVGTQ
jgi:hypothetical protein